MTRPSIITSNIVFYCKKWAETVRFYRDRLFLPVLFEADWFVEFHLTDTSRLSVADETRASIPSAGGAGVTLCLEVDDIEAQWHRLEAAGLFPTPIRTHAWNARVFYLHDPEGHRIEVWKASSTDAFPKPPDAA